MAYIRKNGIWRPNQLPSVPVVLDTHHPLAKQLVGLWLLNGTTHDYSNNNGDAIPANGSNWPLLAVGQRGPSYSFPGSGADLQVVQGGCAINSNTISVNAWVNSSTPTASRMDIIHQPDANAWWFNLQSGLISFYGSGPGGYYQSIGVLPSNTLTMITAVYNGSNVSFYFNGQFDSSVSATGTILNTRPSAVPIEIAGLGGNNYVGSLSTISVYDRPLSAGEVLELYLEPYSMLKQKVDRKYYVGAGSAFPSFSFTGASAAAVKSASIVAPAGSSTAAIKSASLLSTTGLSTAALKSAIVAAMTGTSSSALQSAATFKATGSSATGLVSAVSYSIVGSGVFSPIPAGILPTFTIAGQSAPSLKSAALFGIKGAGIFSPITFAASATFGIVGVSVVNFVPAMPFAWVPVPVSPIIWTAAPDTDDLWTPQIPGPSPWSNAN